MRRSGALLLIAGLALSGCTQTAMELASDSAMKPRDKQLLANARYAPATIPDQYKRQLVTYHRKELPGTVVVDTDNRYLYYVMPEGKAIRYGVTVGEEAQVFSGVARVARKEEWPRWVPTANIKRRLGNIPDMVEGGVDNPMGARALYLYEGNRDTLFRLHGTNQPEYIGQAISSGCIRLTNEDIIDLYNRVKMGTPVVVLAPTGAAPPQIVAAAVTSS
jgi:lipoprotein-anchoring transpeptidase ErfK/SrfK